MSPFDMTICSPVTERRRVLLIPICSTVPFSSPITMNSPTRKGLSSAIESDAKRSPRTFCTASAIAMPPTPSPATSGMILTPRFVEQHQERDDPDQHHADETQDVEARRALRGREVVAAPHIDQVRHGGRQPEPDLPPHDDQDRRADDAIHPRRHFEPAHREVDRDRDHEDARGRVDQRAEQQQERDGRSASCFLSLRMVKARAIGSTVNQTANCHERLDPGAEFVAVVVTWPSSCRLSKLMPSSYSSPSSRSFRVSVFRPQPMSFAASWRRPLHALERGLGERALEARGRDVQQRRSAACKVPRRPGFKLTTPVVRHSAAAPSPPRSARNVLAPDLAAGRGDREPPRRVHELAHVAGPGEGDEPAARAPRSATSARRQARARQSRGSAPSRLRDVARPLAQRRARGCGSRSGGAAGPRGTALLHERVEVLVRRRDHAHVDARPARCRRRGRTRLPPARAAAAPAARRSCRRSRRGTACRRRPARSARGAWPPRP